MKSWKSAAGDLPRLNLTLPSKELKLLELHTGTSRSSALPSPVSAAELVLLDETATVTVAPAVTSLVSTWSLGFTPTPFATAKDERDFREVSAEAFVRRIPVFLFNVFIATAANGAMQFSNETPGNTSILIRFLAIIIPCFIIFVVSSLFVIRYFRATSVRAVIEICCVVLLPVVILTKPSAESIFYCETSLFLGIHSFFIIVNILRPSKWCMFALTLVTSEEEWGIVAATTILFYAGVWV